MKDLLATLQKDAGAQCLAAGANSTKSWHAAFLVINGHRVTCNARWNSACKAGYKVSWIVDGRTVAASKILTAINC